MIANVAIARELAGWCWSRPVMDPNPHRSDVGQATYDDQEQAPTRQGRSSAAHSLPALLGVNIVHARCAARAPR